MMKRILIAGSRNFKDYGLLYGTLMRHTDVKHEEVEFISGKAPGADRLGEKFAKERGMGEFMSGFPANWKDIEVEGAVIRKNRYGEYNAVAGNIRNRQMAEYLAEQDDSEAFLFWDGTSSGTKNMLDLLIEYSINTHIIYF